MIMMENTEYLLTLPEAFIVFASFLLAMFVILFIKKSLTSKTREEFYVANRSVGIFSGAMSVAVSWIWAPALFVASAISFELGLVGALWFIVPNIACFFIFAPIAVRMRKTVPKGYTLSGYFRHKFPNDHRPAKLFVITTILFAMAAMIENLVAIGKLFELYTGAEPWIAIVVMTALTLAYALSSGLKASVITDVFQMLIVVLVGLVLVPWVFNVSDTNLISALSAGSVEGELRYG